MPAGILAIRVSETGFPAGPEGPRLTRTARGAEFHYPPLRQPGAALLLLAFGVFAIAITAASLAALWPADGLDAGAILALVLFGVFAAPFTLFGALFVLLAIGLAGGSLTVEATPAGLAVTQRLFGVTTSHRALARGDIAGLDAELAPRFQRTASLRPVYRLVARARTAGQRPSRLVAGDSLMGEDAAAAVRAAMLDCLDLRELAGPDETHSG